MEAEEVAAAFDRLHAAGEVRHFGVSNYSAAQIELLATALDRPLVVNQLQLSLAHPDLIDDTVVVNDSHPERTVRGFGTLQYCMKEGIAVQAWAPLGAGKLVRDDPAPPGSRLAAARHELAALAHARGWNRPPSPSPGFSATRHGSNRFLGPGPARRSRLRRRQSTSN